MNNYQFLYQKGCEKNKQLKKQIEAMRNCFNCGLCPMDGWMEAEFFCKTINEYKEDCYPCEHWKQKEVKNGE